MKSVIIDIQNNGIYLAVTLCCLLVCVNIGAYAQSQVSNETPNIILIMADDLGEGDFKRNKAIHFIAKDRSETRNVASQYPELVTKMSQQIKAFLASAKASHSGADYPDKNYHPVDSWPSTQAKKLIKGAMSDE